MMDERKAWQFIGEAFEKFAETGEHTILVDNQLPVKLTFNGLCFARSQLWITGMISDKTKYDMLIKIRQEVDANTPVGDAAIYLVDKGRENAADRAMLCYLLAAELDQEVDHWRDHRVGSEETEK